MSTTYPATVEGLAAALAALGNTAEAIAQTLIAGGWRGYREDCDACPTAKYLLAVVEGAESVLVNRDWVAVWVVPGEGPAAAMVPTPDAVKDFIADFDDTAAWPELDIDWLADARDGDL